jgi:hypothetical protein
MSATTPSLAIACGVFFVVSLALFLITSAKRRRLDKALSDRARRLGKTPLDTPERRPTYDQDYLIAYIEDARSAEVAAGRTALDYYARTILAWDMWFAVAFAIFIVAANLLAADALARWPWAARIFLIFACMGALYGIADLAEDFMLRKIFRHAKEIEAKQKAHRVTRAKTEEAAARQAALTDAALADAAQTDAANALTRLKIVTLTASVAGGLVFLLIFVTIDGIIKKAVAAARETASA